MKKEIHAKEYRPVLFVDSSNGSEYIIPSTVVTKETMKAKDKKEVSAFPRGNLFVFASVLYRPRKGS